MKKTISKQKKAKEAAAKKAAAEAIDLESDRRQEALISKSISEFPDDKYAPNELLNKGVELHNSGDDEKALGIFLRIASLGVPGMQFCCSQMYSEGMGTEVDNGKALFWMGKAAEQDYPVAQYEYAMMHNDLKTRLKWLLRAYKQTEDAEVREKAEVELKKFGVPLDMI